MAVNALDCAADSDIFTSPLLIGVLGAPHGVRGWLRINAYTQDPEAIFKYKGWVLGPVPAKTCGSKGNDTTFIRLDQTLRLDQAKSFRVDLFAWRKQGNRWVAKLQGTDTPEQAKALCGLGIYVARSVLPKLAEGEYYWRDLIGAEVLTLDNKVLGTVSSMIETVSNDVLVVSPSVSSQDKRERLIPWIHDQVVTSVERKKNNGADQQAASQVARIWVDWDLDF